MTRTANISLIAIFVACASCASVPNLDDARAEILRLDADWSRAAEGRDVDRVVSFWSEDAMVLPPGRPPIIGQRAIRKFVAKSFQTPGFGIAWKTTDVSVASSGDMAYSTGINRITVNGPDGKQVVLNGKAVAVWRRDSRGAWRCVLDIWNDTPLP